MATIVLVHGAWQSAATWDLVLPTLRRMGHVVHTAKLTGLERPGGELDDRIDLATHIDDLRRLLESAELTDVVLVGHSYAGMIVTGVAEYAAERLNQLVYVDAFVPRDGQTAYQFLPEPLRLSQRAQADANGGFRICGSERQLNLWGLKPGAAREFVRARLTDFSIKCFLQPLRAPDHRAEGLDRAYIACVAQEYPARPIFAPFAERARNEGWPYHELTTGHDCHVEDPDGFCYALDALCQARAERRYK